MKVSVNEEVLFVMNETKKKVICNDILADTFEADMKRRIAYILAHKYERCFKRLKEEWVDSGKLASLGVESIPTNPDALAELIFAHPSYKCRKTKLLEELEGAIRALDDKAVVTNELIDSEASKAVSSMVDTCSKQLADEVSKLI